uniref:HTH psq-type domain-containing protein n=1 Tax=Mastacembelus armatus TaxID=205130 RepID=A0A7N8YAU4_9TELE
MSRQWKRKTDRGVPANVLKVASDEVTGKGKSVRSVAKAHGICHVTLQILRDQGSREKVGVRQKKISFVLRFSIPLSLSFTSKFAFQLAVTYNIKHPQTWDENQMAGPDWFSLFMKGNPSLSMSAEAQGKQLVGPEGRGSLKYSLIH